MERQSNSNSLILVIHEIYGINQHIKSFCELLSKQGFDVTCPHLLEREKPFEYFQEEAAYRHFMEQTGFDRAAQKIKDLLLEVKDEYEKIYIIGFSIGATVAWLCSEEDCVDGIVGYYGSRIRDYLELTPQCPIMLFFPQEEQSFNVDELLLDLEKKNIKVHKFTGKHGFSDPYSSRYDAKSEQEAFSKAMDFLLYID
ncbi:dienelactone hydrolase [Cytobacillus firmus]|uniref:Dienelactone hydrolase n=3 Tax=Bacillaceae TaxID=186817 RepID=A0A366JQP4_CYTFI|nr:MULTISPECIES: dienelactone hydrolase family protein [Cytobacillus]RBP89966.1 dienelactone hydrolase [Cytobacillus firmus]TDX40414.1 dienelactone hydrolase [Cytobacillus oceanisediminis]